MSTRKRPASADGPSPKSTTTTVADILNSSPDRRHSTPSADERREAALLAELSELGYTVAISCVVCGHALTTERSKALHLGPKCAAKAVTK
jgi:hypothetical protein